MVCLLFWSLTHANSGVECSGRDSWEKMGQPLAKLLHVSLEFCLLSQLYPSRYFDILLQFNPPVERSNESSIVSFSYCNIIGQSPNSGSLITITPSYNHLRCYNICIMHLICEGFICISLELLLCATACHGLQPGVHWNKHYSIVNALLHYLSCSLFSLSMQIVVIGVRRMCNMHF